MSSRRAAQFVNPQSDQKSDDPSSSATTTEWNGTFWEATTLVTLGLIYQIGHEGHPCPFPAQEVRTMTVVDVTGIHQVRYQYCTCSTKSDYLSQLLRNTWYLASATNPTTCATFKVLELFRLLNVIGNVNCPDFIGSLERLTNTMGVTGMKWLPDRYKQFVCMSHQYAFIKRAQRSGRGHAAAGVEATGLGEMVVVCWACPYDKHNFPDDWCEVDPKYKYGAFMEPKGYKKHLKNYVAEKDISTCIAFAALLQKDTRLMTGLRTSGVGGCVCAQHECVHPNGIGDLQKGEHYSNMDYILVSAIVGLTLLALTISYDIACQWKKKLAERNNKLLGSLQIDLNVINVQCGLPIWHASSHEGNCQDENSLSFLVGVGKSDGEGIERTWADLNPAAFHTKDMGMGNRTDTLDDKIDSHNFRKNLGQGDALRRKLIVAIAEAARQASTFKEVNTTVKKELQQKWDGR
ncbi:hypothetical protein C8J57DRAFT_1262522 [Mycena rebaudengoi]|nr:hypothetical protein C8J57DRAFT_1262522 [Mycena rebaudengoi]